MVQYRTVSYRIVLYQAVYLVSRATRTKNAYKSIFNQCLIKILVKMVRIFPLDTVNIHPGKPEIAIEAQINDNETITSQSYESR